METVGVILDGIQEVIDTGLVGVASGMEHLLGGSGSALSEECVDVIIRWLYREPDTGSEWPGTGTGAWVCVRALVLSKVRHVIVM